MTESYTSALQRALAEVPWVARFTYRDTTGSTMDDARKYALEAGADYAHGALFVADEQTQGRGRRGRTWLAPPGSALLFSAVAADVADSTDGYWPLRMGVAVVKALRSFTGDARIGLKYPNDVVCDGRKLGGMLVETVESRGRAVIIGVGINTSQPVAGFPPEISDISTSLNLPVSDVSARADLLAGIMNEFAAALQLAPARIISEFSSLCITLGQPTRIATADGVIEGTAVGLDPTGALIVQEIGGAQRVVLTGDIQHLRVSA